MTVYRRPDPIPRPLGRAPVEALKTSARDTPPRPDDGASLARRLFALVLALEFPEGSTLPVESDLCDRFGVSRTALREAIKRLEAKGILNVRRRTGTVVASRRNWALLDADLMRWEAECGRLSVCEDLWEALTILLPAISARPPSVQTIEDLESAARMIENPLLSAVAFRAIDYFKGDGRAWLSARLARTRLPATLVGE